MEEIKNYSHTKQESREALAELDEVRAKTMKLYNDYLKVEKPLRGKPNYMELRKSSLETYRRDDEAIWRAFVDKYSKLGWKIGSK